MSTDHKTSHTNFGPSTSNANV